MWRHEAEVLKSEGGFVFLTAEEMAEFDRIAIEDYGIDELILMENAGVAVAKVARQMLHGRVGGRMITILVGKGNNGGDGLVAARHLRNWGARMRLALGGERGDLREIPAKQFGILEKMGMHQSSLEEGLAGADLLIDAIFGYNLRGNPREPEASVIRRANSSKIPILAVDTPSGLDASSGTPGDPCVLASATVTLGLPKVGFLNPRARPYLGDLYLADISFPAPVYSKFSQRSGIFGKETVVRVW